MDKAVKFSTLVDMLEAIVRSKKAPLKRKHLTTFLDHVYKDHEYFSAMRLILPELDKERATYGLKETALAKFLAEALGLSKDSEDAKKLVEWRRGGKGAGQNAGNFPLVLAEVLQNRQRQLSAGISIRELNETLDKLAMADGREDKVPVLMELLHRTNVREMKWVAMIILKELKLGISEKTVLSEFHRDAEDLFNVTCDLKLVCEKLTDRSQRYKRQDIEPGKAVRPQLASRVVSAQEAWKQMKGKEVVVETKFDGDRIQVHKSGNELHFFSRSFKDHTEYMDAMAKVLLENILPEKCILDGEMTVWDKSAKQFVDFGNNQTFAKAARDGVETNAQLCYIAFDILYFDDSSVIHRPLRERHQLLLKALRPVKGRLEMLNPKDGLNTTRQPGEPMWSMYAESLHAIEHFFLEVVENREEGIIVKDLDSKWDPGDRAGKWLKLKPDYVSTSSDLDVLIIGGYYGSGRRGGEVAQYLLGVAEKPKGGGYPTRFASFCKVGTGLTDEEADHLRSRLKPYLRRNEPGSKPPSFFRVTGHHKERPDVWVDQPEKSVVLQIKSDIRTIQTEVFAAAYSLRFPRVEKIRYDKPWYDCLDEATLVKIVSDGGGGGAGREQYGQLEEKPSRQRKRQIKAPALPRVPSHLLVTDVSHVAKKSTIFEGLVFYFVGFLPDFPKERIHALVVENGGQFSMNLTPAVTHAIANDKNGFRYVAAAQHGDVVHYRWFLDCTQQQTLCPVKSRHYLHLSDKTKVKLQQEIDAFGDCFYDPIEDDDLRQIFGSIDLSMIPADSAKVSHYEKKYCSSARQCLFRGCRVHVLPPLHSGNLDSRVVADCTLQRLALEVAMHGGFVAKKLSTNVTHVVVFSPPEQPVMFSTVRASAPSSASSVLESCKVHVVTHGWIEETLSSAQRQDEGKYELRPPAARHAAPADLQETSSRSVPEASTSLDKEKLRDDGKPSRDKVDIVGNTLQAGKKSKVVNCPNSQCPGKREAAAKRITFRRPKRKGSRARMIEELVPEGLPDVKANEGDDPAKRSEKRRRLARGRKQARADTIGDPSNCAEEVSRRALSDAGAAIDTVNEGIIADEDLFTCDRDDLNGETQGKRHFEQTINRDHSANGVPGLSSACLSSGSGKGAAEQDDADSFLDDFLPWNRSKGASQPSASCQMRQGLPTDGLQNGFQSVRSPTNAETTSEHLVQRQQPLIDHDQSCQPSAENHEQQKGKKETIANVSGSSMVLSTGQQIKKQKVSYKDLVSKLLSPV